MSKILSLAFLLTATSLAFARPGYGCEVSTIAGASNFGWGGPGDVQYSGGQYAKEASASSSVIGASAVAYGSLATGAMHLGAWTQMTGDVNLNQTDATAHAELWDTVTLYWGTTTVSQIPLHITFDGSRTGEGAAQFIYEGASIDYSSYQDGGNKDLFEVNDFIVAPLNDGPIRTTTFSVYTHAIVGASTLYNPFYGQLGEPSSADYTHTLKFMWDLPAGVTYTSASGAFHPQPSPQAVPEPASMLALGMGGLALLRRRRK